MPRTVEGIVEAHLAAAELRKAGKPIWSKRINLADVFHNEDLTFIQRRDAIVARIRRSGWLAQYDEYDELTQVVEELSEAENTDEFDGPWDVIYDYADIDRVWISTS